MDPASYTIGTYTYIFQGRYGSPQVDATQPTIKSAKVASDGKSVRLVIDGLQIGHVHELKMAGIKSKTDGNPLLHDIAYYTLWHLPKDWILGIEDSFISAFKQIANPLPNPHSYDQQCL